VKKKSEGGGGAAAGAGVVDSAAIWRIILDKIPEGLSLAECLARFSPPLTMAWASRCLRESPALAESYRVALEVCGDTIGASVVAIASEPVPDDLDPSLVSAWLGSQKLRVDARKWAASKLSRSRWGEHVAVDVGYSAISITSALAEARARVAGVAAPRLVQVRDRVAHVIDMEPAGSIGSS